MLFEFIIIDLIILYIFKFNVLFHIIYFQIKHYIIIIGYITFLCYMIAIQLIYLYLMCKKTLLLMINFIYFLK